MELSLKLIFDKAYDKVKWSFLFHSFKMKSLSAKWISFFMGGSVAVNINDDVEHFFQMKKDLRQGDTPSPILFNILTGMLAILIKRPKEK
jgi:hypothetical protein